LRSSSHATSRSVQTKYEIAFQTDAAENGPRSIGVAREGAILQMTNGRLR
jgi:hypothetical protein